jgi:hypothetical protein
MNKFVVLPFVCIVAYAHAANAQSATRPFEASVQVVAARSGEFEDTEFGIGGLIAWNALRWMGLESEFNLFPADFPADGPAFTGSRIEGLFGVTAGPRLGGIRPFARARAGFLRFSPAPEPFACITIFPPPVSCLMAAGDTRPVLDLGGGLALFTSDRTFLRIDVGDRLVRYPGPTFTTDFQLRDSGFFSHDIRFAFGGGWRF